MYYNYEYSLPGGLDGLSRAIHKQQSTNVDKPEEQEPKVVKEPKKASKKVEDTDVEITEDMSSLDKVLAYADAFSKEYRATKKTGNMIMIDEDLKINLEKLKLAFSGEKKLSVKHLANAIIKMFFEDEAVNDSLKSRLKKL